MLSPFHLAFPVDDLEAARFFYGTVLGCREGRSTDKWIDFDLFGHQIVAHQVRVERAGASPVDGHNVPIPHFGVVMGMDEWKALVARLKEHNIAFGMEPQIRFVGQPGEQATTFVLDPSGNALEFKAFQDPDKLFAKQ